MNYLTPPSPSQNQETVTRISFSHRTEYTYSGPVHFLAHRFVLRPREDHRTRLESMTLTTEPASKLRWSEDIEGNIVALGEFTQDAPSLVVTSEFTVAKRSEDDPASPPSNILTPYPPVHSGIEEAATYLFRRTVFPSDVDGLRSWVIELNLLPHTGNEAPIFDNLASQIHSVIKYQRRESPGVQTPLETLSLGSGSCRDTAVLLMEAARTIGYAARFVSGYMESENTKVARGSTHAWVEVYLPHYGWIGYDPSIGHRTGVGHIAVATSYHPRGIMPISGKFDRNGSVYSGMQVAISSKRLPV
ncbi:MAG: transglutaminase family protein [Roseibacillus sp.]